MGVIKKKFPLLATTKAAKLLSQEVESQLAESGLSAEQIESLCLKIAIAAKAKMNGEYTVMGGYAPEEQLLTAARKLMHELDEKEELETLLIGESETPKNSPAESDLEDAYNVADSIEFVGSEKQVNWARTIATNASESIACAMKERNLNLPCEAKWWIENRGDIEGALARLIQS